MQGRLRLITATAVAAAMLLIAIPVAADEPHDPRRSGHPLRLAAYIVHPVGWLIDTLIFRPAHWLVNKEPYATIFGHED